MIKLRVLGEHDNATHRFTSMEDARRYMERKLDDTCRLSDWTRTAHEEVAPGVMLEHWVFSVYGENHTFTFVLTEE